MMNARTLPFKLTSLLLLCATVSFVTVTESSAQNGQKVVVGVRIDTNYANSTIVHTRNGVSDAQVLREIEKDYSLGDEIRITVAPPKPQATPKPQVAIKERVEVQTAARISTPPSIVSLSQVRAHEAGVLSAGSIVRAGELQFAKDAATIEPNSYTYLDDMYRFLTENPRIIVEVGGHTNTLPDHDYCLRLSEARAKAVVSYLAGKGVPMGRLRVRGYGKTQPILAANNEAAHRMNQRVELKVLQN